MFTLLPTPPHLKHFPFPLLGLLPHRAHCAPLGGTHSCRGQGRAGWHTVTVRLQKLLPPLPLPHSLPAMGLPPCLAPFHPTRPLPASHVLGVSEARKEGGADRGLGCCLRLIYCRRPHPSGPSPPPHQAPSPRGFRRGPSPGRGRGLSGGGIRPYLASLRRRWMSGSIWAVGRRGL